MSSVDERIVEMRFENDQFEKGVSTSLKTLDKLKAGLNLDGAANSLSNLQTTANRLDISHISDGVDKITDRFSLLGIVADQAIRTATNGLINLGMTLVNSVKSLTIDQIGVGFDKYAEKTQAIQVIMNATGKTIDEVNESIDKLNWFTDETSYSLMDMVGNIGKFTSSNIPLEKAVTSMIGIANAAGLAGAGVQNASHAMEGFSKAMAMGYMNNRNWEWIRTARMDTAQFKQTLIDAAVDLEKLIAVQEKTDEGLETHYYVANRAGKANKKLEVSVADFQTQLKEGWLNVDVMTRGLKEFGETTEKIYNEYEERWANGDYVTTSELIEQMGDELEGLGLKAFKASQEAKTFREAMDSVKDAVSTGWMKTFEYIFGNYEEARKLWTTVANEMWDVFAGPGEARNEIFQEWHDSGGYRMFWDSIKEIWEGLKAIGNAVKDVFDEFFPPLTTERLMSFTKKISDFGRKFKAAFTIDEIKKIPDAIQLYLWEPINKEESKAKENIENIRNIFSGLFSIIKFGRSIFSSFITILSPLSRLLKELGRSLFDLSGQFGKNLTDWVDAFVNSEKYAEVVNKLTGYVDKFTTFLIQSTKTVKKFVKAFINSEPVQKFFGAIGVGVKLIKDKLSPYLDKARKKITQFFDNLTGWDDEDIERVISNIILWFEKLYEKAGEVYHQIKQFLSPAINGLKLAFLAFKPHLDKVVVKVKQFWNEMVIGKQLGPRIVEIFGRIGERLSKITTKTKDFIKGFSFKDLFSNIQKYFSPIIEKIGKWVDDIRAKLENLDLTEVANSALKLSIIPVILGITAAFIEAAKLLRSSKYLVENLTTIIKKFKTGFKSKLVETAKAVTLFATAVAILAGSLKLISTIDSSKIKESLIAIGLLAGGLTAITILIGALSRFNIISGMKDIAVTFLGITGSIIALAGAMKLLETVDPTTTKQSLIILGHLASGLVIVSILMGKTKKKMAKGSMALLAFASSVLILSEAIRRLAISSDPENINSAFKAVVVLVAIMGAITALGGKIRLGTGLGMLGMIGAIVLIIKLLEKASDEYLAEIAKKALDNFGLIKFLFITLAGLALIAAAGGENAGKTGFAILAMTASVLIIYEAIKKLGEMDNQTLTKGGIAVFSILSLFALLSLTLWKTSKNAVKAGGAILAMSAALLVVYLAVKAFGKMKPEVMIKGLLGVIPVLLTFAAITSSLGKLKGVKNIFGALIGIAIVIGTIAAALTYLTLFDWKKLAVSVSAIGGTMLAFAGAIRLAKGGAKPADKSMLINYLGMIGAVVAIGLMIREIAGYEWEKLAAAGGSISICLLALAGAMRIVAGGNYSKMGWDSFLTLAVALGAMWVIASILEYLADKPWDGMLAAAHSISEVLIAVTGATAIIALVAAAISAVPFPALMIGLGEMMIAIASLGVTLMGLAWLADFFNKDGGIQRGFEILGKALGDFIGGLIGESVVSAAKKIEEVGTSLTKFAENAAGFFSAVDALKPGTGTNLLNLANALNTFIGGSFIDWLATKMSKDEAGLGTLKEQLTTLADALKDFGEKSANINLDNIGIAVKAGELLNDLLNKLAPTEGLAQKIFGEQRWSTISSGLAKFGESLANLSEYDSSQIIISNIQNAVDAGFILNGLLDVLPRTKGAIQTMIGEKSWTSVSSGLKKFGESLVELSKFDSSQIIISNIQNAVDAGFILNDLLTALPPNPGTLLEWFAEGQTWDQISDGLGRFGRNIASFSEHVRGKFDSDFTQSLTEIQKLPGIMSSLYDVLGDDTDAEDFKASVKHITSALKMLSNNFAPGVLKTENIENATDFVHGILSWTSDFQATGEALGESLSYGLGNILNPDTGYSLASDFLAAFISGIETAEGIDTKAQGIANSLIEGIAFGVDFMLGIGESYVNKLSSSIEVWGPIRALAAGVGLAGQVISGAGSKAIIAAMTTAGHNVGQGFIDGILEKKDSAFSAGATLGNASAAGARAATKERSPSRVFMQIGEYCGEGLAIGFNNSTASVRAASVKLAEESMAASVETLKGFENISDLNINSQPVITPVLDLSTVGLQAQRLNSILNGSAAVSLSGKINMDQQTQNIDDLLLVSSAILEEIRSGHDLYFDDGAFAGRINRRLGARI